MDARDRTLLDYLHQRRAVRVYQAQRLTWRLADQAAGAMVVALHHPVSNDLHRDAADRRRLHPAARLQVHAAGDQIALAVEGRADQALLARQRSQSEGR
jgi:hypothetical protein